MFIACYLYSTTLILGRKKIDVEKLMLMIEIEVVQDDALSLRINYIITLGNCSHLRLITLGGQNHCNLETHKLLHIAIENCSSRGNLLCTIGLSSIQVIDNSRSFQF